MICERCGVDWEGAPGHPRDYCSSILLQEIALAGRAFLENKRPDTAEPFMRFKNALERYFGRVIS